MTTITLPKTLIGLYSTKAADQFGTSVYLGIDGKEYYVTGVVANEESIRGYKWEDTIRVAYVTRYLRDGRDSIVEMAPMFAMNWPEAA